MKRKVLALALLCAFSTALLACGGKTADDSFSVLYEATSEGTSESSDLSEFDSYIAGMWQTASIGYVDEDDEDSMQPDYYVQFTDTEINYGHLKGDEFVLDHSDEISTIGRTADGLYRIQAGTESGGQYTFQTSEDDPDVLEYYETWNEEVFSEVYRAGASLSRR
ncbi:MAG: hypothetical protein K6F37_09750 [Lachnospiraceae bacterium]|nr:hypothetical protein [Lachnospiraceae bacterium]